MKRIFSKPPESSVLNRCCGQLKERERASCCLNEFRDSVKKLVENFWFETTIQTIILFNSVLLGTEFYGMST